MNPGCISSRMNTQDWAQSEELDCDAEAVLPVVQALVELSREAMSQRKGMYMWGSL